MKNKRMVAQRILSLFLAIVLSITMQGMAAFAAEDKITGGTPDCEHVWGEEEPITLINCYGPGESRYTCTKCGAIRTKIIPKREHRWDAGTVTKKATCGDTGIMSYRCMHLNCDATKEETIPIQGYHNWKTAGKVTKEPTAKSKGTYATSCVVCNTPRTYNLLYAKVGNFDSGMKCLNAYSGPYVVSDRTLVGTLAKNAAVWAFEDENGSNSGWTRIYYEHGKAKTAYVKSEYIIIQTGETSGKKLKIGSKVTGKMGTYKVTGKSTVEYIKAAKSATVTVPVSLKVNGKTYKVTSVAAKLLKNNKKVKKVVIGSNVTKIGAEAFSGCKNLKSITIKSTKLKSVGKNAIKNINKKASITCPKNKKTAYKKLFKSSTGYKKTMKIN